jgi:L-threonylcarbamoyladenylate synthase
MARALPDVLPIPWPADRAEPPAATEEALGRAARLLAEGGLVAIPTETVYGLAADALDADAVDRIYSAKGRPATNPLIVHVADAAMARRLAGAWPEAAERIAAAHWPGPVTVVVPRGPRIPDVVTAGGPTVALRCPAQPAVRRLIAKLGRPLAAPSANRSTRLSPTTAGHVLDGLGKRVDLILDGGPCLCGIESTVVDCTVSPPRILRPGPVGREALAAAIGGPLVDGPAAPAVDEPLRSPGLEARHYAPQTPLEVAADGAARVAEIAGAGGRVAWLALEPDDPRVRAVAAHRGVLVVPMPADPASFAASLYAALHAVDRRGLDRVVVDAPPDTEAWRAVADRLRRGARSGPGAGERRGPP